MILINELHQLIDYTKSERCEQYLAKKYIRSNDIVLELGGRYGSVSCTINPILKIPNNHVVVEPDSRVWECLEINKVNNDCCFHIIKGCISNNPMNIVYPKDRPAPQQYATKFKTATQSNIPNYSLNDILSITNIDYFNVLVADCEGCIPLFIQENLNILDKLRLIILEQDDDSIDYTDTTNCISKYNFHQIDFMKPNHIVYAKSLI